MQEPHPIQTQICCLGKENQAGQQLPHASLRTYYIFLNMQDIYMLPMCVPRLFVLKKNLLPVLNLDLLSYNF